MGLTNRTMLKPKVIKFMTAQEKSILLYQQQIVNLVPLFLNNQIGLGP